MPPDGGERRKAEGGQAVRNRVAYPPGGQNVPSTLRSKSVIR
ncbi:hypothetical protein B4135_1484 [Caldibacillus debilis]|uniref:Uncharacterized protein n=1 Tax=Caldibacillus debilis TaxID=301148 RepID=A0A150MD08_9BACI|nr:hypothetical protein B4135_1484 [Caldibacillus debilis]